MEKEFFKRKVDKNKYDNFINKISPKLNIHNLNFWDTKLNFKYYREEFIDEYLAYRFVILKKWIIEHQEYNDVYINELLNNIKKLGLDAYLNALEKNYIYHFQSCDFAISRNIKLLIVDFPILPGEEVYYHYEDISLWIIFNDLEKEIITVGDFYIGNTKLVFTNNISCTYIKYDEILSYSTLGKFIVINCKNKKKYKLQTSDVHLLLISIERIYKIIKKEFVHE